MLPIEGFLLKVKSHVWIVKGVDACRDVIAYPRYTDKGEKLDAIIVRHLVNNHLGLTDCAPVPVPLLDLDKVEVMDPRELIHNDDHAKEFSQYFPCEAGLTGSRALWKSNGDIDLVFYDSSCFRDILEVLRELRMKGVTEPPRIGKWDGLGPRAKEARRKYSLLEGLWNGIPYSIRLVEGPRAPRRPIWTSWIVVEGRVTKSDFKTPTRIYLEDGTVVESLRLQHTEVRKGWKIRVLGVREVRTDGEVVALPRGGMLELLAT